jgi:NAD(P)-dependent dehydrogenase (short-subunit alcohol dehydrogenase family)
MSNPVVLITGALTGIGRATALGFAKEGARLVVSGRHDDAGAALAAELRDMGAEAEFIRADVRHEDDIRRLSIARSRASAASTSQSTTPGPKANLAR